MATVLLLLAAVAATVTAILRILGVTLVSPRARPARKVDKASRPARAKRVRSALPWRKADTHPPGKAAKVQPAPGVRAASSRLLVALVLIGAGAALLIVMVIQWMGGVLRGILS